MSYYDQLKNKTDILQIALGLGYNGKRSGNCYLGDCPAHQSKNGACLVIWLGTKRWKCFHCSAGGDVINLVQLYKKCGHKEAVNFLADKVEMPHLGVESLSPEELAQKQADMNERTLVEDMLSAAAYWYHSQLKSNLTIEAHLLNHYGFSKDIIDELLIGFAPAGTSDPEITSDLAEYLEGHPQFKGQVGLSGLFSFKDPGGPYFDHFKGRIMFPYLKGGKVVYFAARATSVTPENPFECYTDTEGNVKRDAQGKAEHVKYKKLRVHDPEDEKKKHISRFIQNDAFMGEDRVRGEKEIIITEGAPDWISAVDKGFAAISPVTVSFREKDFEKLVNLTANAESIYIVNDSEDNLAGEKGALRTANHLLKAGRNVYIVKLPRPQGVSKVDLNEYFLTHSSQDLLDLMKATKPLLGLIIEGLQEDFIRAKAALKSEIIPMLIPLDATTRQHYLEKIVKKVDISRRVLFSLFQEVKKEGDQGKQSGSADPAIASKSAQLALDPQVLKKRIDVVNAGGVVGERLVIAMYFAALDSRNLPESNKSPNTLAIKNAGHFGSGKSYVLMACLEIYPESGYHLVTNGSAKSIYYLEEGLKRKCLAVAEGFQFQTNNANDSEFVYAIRSLISEGRISYQTAEKNSDGNIVTVEKKLEGPTSFITTTVMEKLEPQFEDRLFTVHPNESIPQTKDIIFMTAKRMEGKVSGLEPKTIAMWKSFHSSLKPADVIIPFAMPIARFITRGEKVPLTTRRASNRVMAVVKTVTLAYQAQRRKDAQGRLISEVQDYFMALQIVRESFRENVGHESKGSEERILHIRDNGPVDFKTLEGKWMCSKASISGWVKTRVNKGILAWCDMDGNVFTDEKEATKAKRSGKAFLRVSDSIAPTVEVDLPTPFDLTGNPDWQEDGKLWALYDLQLNGRGIRGEVLGVPELLGPEPNTPPESQVIETKEEDEGMEEAIRVLGPKGGETHVTGYGEDSNPLDAFDAYFKSLSNDPNSF